MTTKKTQNIYSLVWLKNSLYFLAVGAIAACLYLFLVAGPVIKVQEQRNAIETYRDQALLAANPSQFAAALRQLDKAMTEAGMVRGNTSWLLYSPHDDIAFKMERFQSLAQRAEKLEALPVSSLEVSYGLPDLKSILKKIETGAYGFWLLQEGGLWIVLGLPFILLAACLLLWWIGDSVPSSIPRRVGTVGKSTS